MSDDSDDGVARQPRTTDDLEAVLLDKCPIIKKELTAFRKLSREQKMFVYLLCKNVKESTHVDYKTSINCSQDWRFRLLKAACAMYNGLDPDLREPSLTDLRGITSSYLVFGVKERERESADYSKQLVPLESRPGEEQIQDLFKSCTMPCVKVYFHLVRFTKEAKLLDIFIPAGNYGLLEIPRGDSGPACFKKCDSKSSGKVGASRDRPSQQSERIGSEKNAPTCLFYTRTDARNVPEEEWSFRNLYEAVNKQFAQNYDFQGLFFVKEDLLQERDSFRVLTLSKFSALADQRHRASKETLSRALGQGKWCIIFDFDYESRENEGHMTYIEEEMRKQGRLFTVKSWKELPKTDSKEIDECQRGQRTIYVQAMGCSRHPIAQPSNPSLLKKNLKSKFLDVVFEKNQSPRPVMCVTLCLTARAEELSGQLLNPDKVSSFVKKAFFAESENYDAFKSVTLCIEDSVKRQLASVSDKGTENLAFSAPLNQLCFLFDSVYSSFQAKTQYELPGVSGPFSISCEQFAAYRPYLRLYHVKSGQSKYLSQSEELRTQYMYDARREFLAGNVLTKEMLYIHDELRYRESCVYVERRVMESLKTKVSTSLAYCNNRSFTTWDSTKKQIITLHHEPASGATTIARIVLWRLRKEYPCVEVKDANQLQQAIEGICTIFESSKLPVLILFDSNQFFYLTVHSFVSELNRRRPTPKSVVIFVEKVSHSSHATGSSQILTAKLADEETAAFERIYQESGGSDEPNRLTKRVDNETDKTPFLFGVWHFRQDYKKIDEFIINVLSSCSDDKKNLLHFASMTQLFTHSSLHLSIAAQFFGMPPEQKDPGPVLQRLGIQRHLLIVRKEAGIWGLRPILIVGNKILEQLFHESPEKSRQIEQLDKFVKNLCDMGNNGTSQQLFCLQGLVQQLTSCSMRQLDPQGKFTDFVFTMNRCLTEDQIEGVFSALATTFSEARPHILIHCARFFAYQKGDYSKSLEITRKALGLKEDEKFFSDTKCTEDVVLSLSAHLINCRLSSGPEMAFQDLQSLALDSIRLSKLAQEKVKHSKITGDLVHRAHPFCYEIQAQRILLNGFFTVVCRKDSEHYFIEIEREQYRAVKEAHTKILENIFHLEKMQDEDLLDQETLTEKEMRKLNETKEEFISRYHPSGEPISDLKKLCPRVSDVAFAWTVVDCSIFKIENVKHDSETFDGEFDNFSLSNRFHARHKDLWDRIWRLADSKAVPLYEKLLLIITQCSSKLAKNYFEACVLLILLKPSKALSRALSLTTEWCQKFSYDFHAKFMHGAFHIANALSLKATDSQRVESILEAKKAFFSCDNLTVKETVDRRKRTLPGCNRLRFVLIEGKGLEALEFLPQQQSYTDQQNYIKKLKYRKFTGYLNETNYLLCQELNSWALHVPSKSLQEEQFKQKRKISFAIALAYSGPTPIII